MLRFAGHDWVVKTSEDTRVGPGPNYFSARGVRVDAQGLHLAVEVRDGRVYAAEVVSAESFGYGTYRFVVASDAARLANDLVLGMFTWSDALEYAHREIDVEISRWGRAGSDDAQFVVQPYDVPGSIVRFALPAARLPSIHGFSWRPGQVDFESRAGDVVVRRAQLTRHVPPAGGEHARINLWSTTGRPPRAGLTEVLVKSFVFEPAR